MSFVVFSSVWRSQENGPSVSRNSKGNLIYCYGWDVEVSGPFFPGEFDHRDYPGYKNPACIKSIFSIAAEDGRISVVYEPPVSRLDFASVTICGGLVEINASAPVGSRVRVEMDEETGVECFVGDGKGKSSRGKIRGFSRKSRNRLIKETAKLKNDPNIWVDLTFPDEFFEGCHGLSDIAEKSSKALKRFKRMLGENINGIWKREYESRKSGKNKGDYFPHFHLLLNIPSVELENESLKIRSLWLETLQYLGLSGEGLEKSARVTLNPKSWRIINDRKHASRYVSKYVAKIQCLNDIDDDVSLGRFWGYIGKPEGAAVHQYIISFQEYSVLKRILSKKYKGGYGLRIRKMLNFFVFFSSAEFLRLIDWLVPF